MVSNNHCSTFNPRETRGLNPTLFCTPAQRWYTSLSTLAKFKLTPYIQDANGLYSVQSAAVHAPWCTPDCNFWLLRLSSLALQSCTYMDVCMQHGGTADLCNLATAPTLSNLFKPSRRIEGVNRLDRVRNADIRERLNQEGVFDLVIRR